MPVNKNALTRYKILDDMLSNKYHNYTLDDLVEGVNEKLEDLGITPVTRRCIEGDLAYIKGENSPFLADIESYSVDVYNGKQTVKKRCLRYRKPLFSIFHKEMTSEEKYLLSQALSLLGHFEGLPNLQQLERLRIGLNMQNMRGIISLTRNSLENTNLFAELFMAIAHEQVIRLSYYKFCEAGSELFILLHPYFLKEYNHRWYLFGMADDDGKILCFALDRIKSAEPLPAQKYIKYAGQLDDWFDDIIGITRYEGKSVERILFWVSDNSKDYVLTKPVHDSQIHYQGEKEQSLRSTYPNLSGGDFFSIDCIENYELIRELMSLSADLVVLSPESIKTKIISKINAMQEIYLGL